jgi:hypothetical protein
MKRFLDKKIITSQSFWDRVRAPFGGITTPIVDPQSIEGKLGSVLNDKTDDQRRELIEKAAETLGKNISNRSETVSIFKQNGLSEENYNLELNDAFTNFSIPPLQYNQYIIGLWPLMRDKNFTFKAFLSLFAEVANRYRSPNDIEGFFKSFVSVLPNLEKTLGTSDVLIEKAKNFLLSGKSAKEFQDYLLYQMLLRYGLFNEIPDNKKSDILKATEQLEKMRVPINEREQESLNFLEAKAAFLKVQNEVYEQVTLALMDMQKNNYANLIGVFRNGIDENRIRFYFENLKKGSLFSLMQSSQPYSGTATPEQSEGVAVGAKKSSDTLRKKIFAQDQSQREDTSQAAGATSYPASAPPSTPTGTTESSEFSSIYGKFIVDINEFERTTLSLAKRVDEEIAYILNKQSSSPQIGPFSAGNVFQYLQDENESLQESDRILNLIDQIIGSAFNLQNSLIEKIRSTNVSGSDQIRQKNTALIAIEEKFDLFEKDMRSKQLGLKFNKVLISRQNEYSEAQDLYENIKVEMESNVSARPILAPKAILAGFKMADILEEIAEEFKNIGSNNPIRAEQAMKTARRWENFAKQQRAHVFTEIYPGMAQSIGIEATKPTISPSFSLRGAFVDLVNNVRFAGKFMDKEVESDKRFRDYWNNLFMQSKDPRPMGDIIEEKPKHGNLTTEEDAKLHKKTMRKFKKPTAKSRFKKN